MRSFDTLSHPVRGRRDPLGRSVAHGELRLSGMVSTLGVTGPSRPDTKVFDSFEVTPNVLGPKWIRRVKDVETVGGLSEHMGWRLLRPPPSTLPSVGVRTDTGVSPTLGQCQDPHRRDLLNPPSVLFSEVSLLPSPVTPVLVSHLQDIISPKTLHGPVSTDKSSTHPDLLSRLGSLQKTSGCKTELRKHPYNGNPKRERFRRIQRSPGSPGSQGRRRTPTRDDRRPERQRDGTPPCHRRVSDPVCLLPSSTKNTTQTPKKQEFHDKTKRNGETK